MVNPNTPLNPATLWRPQMNVRPWHRYWARMFDVFIFSYVIGNTSYLFVDYGVFNVFEKMLVTICILIVWVPVEALLLSTFGTTLSKWLFNIRVRTHLGGKPTYLQALKRSLSVFLFGMGGGIPLVSFLCMISSYSTLRADGINRWDHESYSVSHGKFGILRKLVCTAAVIGYLYAHFNAQLHSFFR